MTLSTKLPKVNLDVINQNIKLKMNIKKKLNILEKINFVLENDLLRIDYYRNIINEKIKKYKTKINKTASINLIKIIQLYIKKNDVDKKNFTLQQINERTIENLILIDSFKTSINNKFKKYELNENDEFKKLDSISNDFENFIENNNLLETHTELKKFKLTTDFLANLDQKNITLKKSINNVYYELRLLNIEKNNLKRKITDINNIYQKLLIKHNEIKKKISNKKLDVNSKESLKKIKKNYENLVIIKTYIKNKINQINLLQVELKKKIETIESKDLKNYNKVKELNSIDEDIKITLNQIVNFQIDVREMIKKLEQTPEMPLYFNGTIRLKNDILIKNINQLTNNQINNKITKIK